MVRVLLISCLTIILSSSSVYSSNATSSNNYLLATNTFEDAVADDTDYKEHKTNNNSDKIENCYTILGLSYASSMIGVGAGMVGGLFWAFYSKDKKISMGICISGCGLFLIGGIVGIITSNTYCKKINVSSGNSFFDKYDFVFNCNLKKKNYMLAFSFKI
ncbi:MAG: hypothetical protein JXA07_13040 [Spirochaetes bacterium]|nr:hypothetical protein [Spirochaetota bacterium]